MKHQTILALLCGALLLPLAAFAEAGEAEVRLVTMMLTGPLGMALGLAVVTLGIWQFVQQNNGAAIMLVIAGVLITLAPGIYNGYVKRLIISEKLNHKRKHEEKRWGKVYTKWAKVRNCIKRCGANPASNEPLPLSATPIVYEGDTSDLIAELRANYVQASMYRYPRVVTGTGTHFPIM